MADISTREAWADNAATLPEVTVQHLQPGDRDRRDVAPEADAGSQEIALGPPCDSDRDGQVPEEQGGEGDVESSGGDARGRPRPDRGPGGFGDESAAPPRWTEPLVW